jgi:hypothetical protein
MIPISIFLVILTYIADGFIAVMQAAQQKKSSGHRST